MKEKEKKLTNRQAVFVNEYLRCFNATAAAIAAGYSEKSARQTGSDLLAIPDISVQIQARLSEIHMSADEALARLADMGRGDIGDLIDDNGLLDIRAARDKGLTKLLKKIKQKTTIKIGKTDKDDDLEITEIEFEMYSAKDALDTILKAGGKLKDNDITINVNLTDD